jgi:hypothetical protein
MSDCGMQAAGSDVMRSGLHLIDVARSHLRGVVVERVVANASGRRERERERERERQR